MKHLALVLLLLTGCSREKREDPLVAEVTAPIHVTVRSIDATVPRQCLKRPTLMQKLKCPLEPVHHVGCTYVELGTVADSPLESDTPRWQRCTELADILGGVTRVMLNQNPTKTGQVWIEPGEKRVAVLVGHAAYVLLLEGGSVYATILADAAGSVLVVNGEFDWNRAGGLIEALPQLQFDVTNEALDAALAADPEGLAHLTKVMIEDDGASVQAPAWLHAWSRLEPLQRRVLEPALRTAALADNEDALAWFVMHPEMRDAEWTKAIITALKAGTIVPGPLALLAKDHPELAGRVSCEFLADAWESQREYADQELDDLSSIAVPAAIIARLKVKCPWATALLEQRRCSDQLSCVAGDQGPLCTEAMQELAVQSLTLAPEGTRDPPTRKPRVDPLVGEGEEEEGEEEEEEESEVDPADYDRAKGWGPALLAAARVQGPLPPDLVLRYHRRTYAQTFNTPDAGDDFCDEPVTPRSQWLCQLPAQVNEAVSNGCRVNLDDKKRSATFTSEPEEDE